MNTKSIILLSVITALFYCTTIYSQPNPAVLLNREYNLAGKRTENTQYFILETSLLKYEPDGKRVGRDILKLYLECVPEINNEKTDYRYTCKKFIIKQVGAEAIYVPAIEDWSYLFNVGETGYDDKGQVFGIDHAAFENLSDNNGNPIDQSISYWIYNSFIDFHAFCNSFARPINGAAGIQDIKSINQKIIHASANSEPPVDLGSNVEKGSYFKNGEVTLQLIGLGFINNSECAIVNFDSGESSFKMKIQPMPDMEITTVGSSHYKGSLYINTNTFWVEKVVMDEFVLSETDVPGMPNKFNSAIERNTVIKNVKQVEFSDYLEKM